MSLTGNTNEILLTNWINNIPRRFGTCRPKHIAKYVTAYCISQYAQIIDKSTVHAALIDLCIYLYLCICSYVYVFTYVRVYVSIHNRCLATVQRTNLKVLRRRCHNSKRKSWKKTPNSRAVDDWKHVQRCCDAITVRQLTNWAKQLHTYASTHTHKNYICMHAHKVNGKSPSCWYRTCGHTTILDKYISTYIYVYVYMDKGGSWAWMPLTIPILCNASERLSTTPFAADRYQGTNTSSSIKQQQSQPQSKQQQQTAACL